MSRVWFHLVRFSLLGCGLLLRAGPAGAFCLGTPMDLTYPGPAPCDTLQGCIDSEPCNGGVVEIASDEPISEAISFEKGLTLDAAAGFHPILTEALTAATPTDTNGKAGYSIHLEGLIFETDIEGAAPMVNVVQQSSSSLSVEISNDTVIGHGAAVSNPVAVSLSGRGGPIAFDVSGNALVVPDSSEAVGIILNDLPSASYGRIADNIITMGVGGYSVGISVDDPDGYSWSADLVANRISGSEYCSGIRIAGSNGSSVTARVLGNLIVGQASPAVGSGAIALYPANNFDSLDATVVNNTVTGNQVGVRANGNGALSGLLANNIVSGSSDLGVSIDPAFASTFANRDNLVFGGTQSFAPGPGTLIADPLFVGNGDYHLQAGSPAVDAGDDGAVPGDLLTDLDGSPRIQGEHVDLGAFETAPEPAGSAAGAALASFALLRHTLRRAGRETECRSRS